jgi:hypothetical protein
MAIQYMTCPRGSQLTDINTEMVNGKPIGSSPPGAGAKYTF